MKSLIAPFDAYKGNEPYIFVSYAHRNSEIVFRHITRLREEGFRIWYDEGIDPGTDWSDEIAKALANATTFLVFVSPEMVESQNVKKEIVFALSRKKKMIVVHISETTLPDGLDMQLSNIQALLENRFNDKEKFYDRLFASLPATTQGNKITVVNKNKTSNDPSKISWKYKLFGGHKSKNSVQPIEDSLVEIEAPKQNVESVKVIEIKPSEVIQAQHLEKETQKSIERHIVQPKEYNNNVEEEGVISFFPSGTFTIKTVSGEEYIAILNTVSGFPVSFYKDKNNYALKLDAFCRAEFLYQNKDDNNRKLTIHTYDDNNKETIFIEDYDVPSYSNIGEISFLTDKGLRFLSLNRVTQMIKYEDVTPKMYDNIRYVYIRSGGMVYKVPQSLLKYERRGYQLSEDYYGIPYYGGDIFRTNTLKYIRTCKEISGFGHESIYVNVYFTDNSLISTYLLSGLLVITTVLGKISPKITDIDEIFFGNYDVDFAKKVMTDAWDGSKIIPFASKGTAIVYKNDGTNSILELGSLVAVGKADRRNSNYPTVYLKTDHELYRSEIETDNLPLFFEDIKRLTIINNDNKLIVDYLLWSNETGEKRILDSKLEGITENRKESINWNEIEKIDFDNNLNVDFSKIKKAIIIDKNNYAFEVFQPMLYFCYPYTSGGVPYHSYDQVVKIEGGLSISYDKIKKIEFLQEKKEGDKTHYPAKITLRVGGTHMLMLGLGGYYHEFLEFLASIGWFRLNLRQDVKSIEFLH